MHKILPYGRQTIEDDDIEAVIYALKGDYLTTGPITAEFEAEFSKKVGSKHAIAMNSGTSGLHLAMVALGIGPGDAVIVPSVTFLATANCVEYVGAEVIFADVNPRNGLMELSHIEAVFSANPDKRIKAVIPVHLNGQTTDLEALNLFAQKHDLYVVEDACHALGGVFIGQDGVVNPIGNSSFSDITMFSGHPVKTIAMGEAGILTTKHDKIAEKLKLLRSHHMEKRPDHLTNTSLAFDTDGQLNPWYYEMAEPGYNFRCSDIHCALGLSQIKKLDRFVKRRQELVSYYLQEILKFSPLITPIEHTKFGACGWHLFPVLCDFQKIELTRRTLMEKLAEKGVLTQVHYIPVPLQPYYQKKYPDTNIPGALRYYEQVLSLPLFPSMDSDDATHVIKTLSSIVTP